MQTKEISIPSMTIRIGKKDHILTIEEAKQLQRSLNATFERPVAPCDPGRLYPMPPPLVLPNPPYSGYCYIDPDVAYGYAREVLERWYSEARKIIERHYSRVPFPSPRF